MKTASYKPIWKEAEVPEQEAPEEQATAAAPQQNRIVAGRNQRLSD